MCLRLQSYPNPPVPSNFSVPKSYSKRPEILFILNRIARHLLLGDVCQVLEEVVVGDDGDVDEEKNVVELLFVYDFMTVGAVVV